MDCDKELSVYAGIYDIVEANLNTAGAMFEYGKNTFLCDVKSHPQDISVAKYSALSNKDFLQAVYVAVFKRLPDEKNLRRWESKYEEPKENFQREALHWIARSSVAAIYHIRLTDNPYFQQRRGLRYHMLGMLYGLTDKSNLRELGKKLPDPVQRLIRKVFL